MKSLFNLSDCNEIISRINKLTPETKAVWGKMTVAQMVAHAQAPLLVAMSELKLKQGIIGMLFGKMVKKQMVSAETFKKNLPTDKSFLVLNSRNFEEEKEKLLSLVKKFHDGGPTCITKDPHPFFGKMTIEEWDILQWKHLDHHLNQFGV
jgi:hypothetical protein